MIKNNSLIGYNRYHHSRLHKKNTNSIIDKEKKKEYINKKLEKIKTKNKLINHLLIEGKKETAEKILLKTIKELQKSSKKHSSDIIKSAIYLSVPIFKIHTFNNKKKKKKKRTKNVKRIPRFIHNKELRKSLALKFIVKTSDKRRNKMYLWLKNQLILNAQNKGSAVKLKNEIQKEAMNYKHIFKYYKWK